MTPKVTLVSSYSGDWIGIYLDGELRDESHGFSEAQVCKLLGFDVVQIETPEEWLEGRGCLPQRLENVEVSQCH